MMGQNSHRAPRERLCALGPEVAAYVTLFAGAEPALALPDVPDQAAVDRDLAVYEACVGR
jgi:hypothetical protein